MNVFDLKAALMAKHAQHVVLIHFPIGLFIAGTGFDFAARWTKQAVLATAAYANLLAAAASVPFVVVSGLLAWRWQLAGQRLHGVLLLHLLLGCFSGLLIITTGWIRFRAQRPPGPHISRYYLLLEFIGVLSVATTAHLGGFLSGVNLPS